MPSLVRQLCRYVCCSKGGGGGAASTFLTAESNSGNEFHRSGAKDDACGIEDKTALPKTPQCSHVLWGEECLSVQIKKTPQNKHSFPVLENSWNLKKDTKKQLLYLLELCGTEAQVYLRRRKGKRKVLLQQSCHYWTSWLAMTLRFALTKNNFWKKLQSFKRKVSDGRSNVCNRWLKQTSASIHLLTAPAAWSRHWG